MNRFLIGCAALCLTGLGASAADPKVDSAVQTFKQVEGDSGKLKTYCEMSKAMEAAGDKDDDATNTKMDGYVKQLGADFESAWNAGENVDENSADGKKLSAAMDALDEKCSG